jgi:hypothetical protein
MRSTQLLAAALLACALATGCSCGPAISPGGDIKGPGTGGDPSDSNGSNGSGASDNTAPFPKEQACESVSSQASLIRKPVDIIMVIDNSGSMTLEIQSVENNVNVNFAQIIEQSGIDYRVILLAKHGDASDDQSVCIRSPLSGTNCNPIPPAPVNGSRFFHYDIEISSHDSLSRILSTYDTTDTHGFAQGGWKNWLRPGSVKTFIEITDDEADITADEFEAELFALATDGAFGTLASRNYIFHSIVGILPNSPSSSAWLPTDPKKSQKCSSAAAAGGIYEDLSLRTGGLRFPVCETSSYDAVFRAAAQSVIQSSVLLCEFTPAPPPVGTPYEKAYVEYTPGTGGSPEIFLEKSSASACDDQSFTRDALTNKVSLCPQTCDRVKTDASASLAVFYACAANIN